MEPVVWESGFANSLTSTELHALNWQPNGTVLTPNKTDIEERHFSFRLISP